MTIRPTIALALSLCLVPALTQAQADARRIGRRRVRSAGPRRARSDHHRHHPHPTHHRDSAPAAREHPRLYRRDSEYWHLTGAANLAFLKPIGEGVTTNVALVCESGRIYAFLVAERAAPPHLIVRVGADPDAATSAGVPVPAFVARSRVAEYQLMAEESRAAVHAAQIDAEAQIAAMRQDATAQVDQFRSTYPTQLQFPYALDDKAARWPFLVHGMWHDGQFTYVRSTAQETPALYENRDGEPSLIPYDLQHDGLFIVRRLVGSGWLQIGRDRAGWNIDLDDLD